MSKQEHPCYSLADLGVELVIGGEKYQVDCVAVDAIVLDGGVPRTLRAGETEFRACVVTLMQQLSVMDVATMPALRATAVRAILEMWDAE